MNQNSKNKDNIMILNGNGQLTAIPDITILRLGVVTTGDNVTIAQQENARISQDVIQSIQQLGVEDIKTFQYVIDRLYDYENGTRIDRGYSIRNIFEIRITDMNLVGTVIDTAVNSGANAVDFINFEVSALDYIYQQALNLAVRNAYQKAQSISASLGTRINPVPKSIIEDSTAPIPYSSMFTAREDLFATPIEPGDKQITASVTVEFIYD